MPAEMHWIPSECNDGQQLLWERVLSPHVLLSFKVTAGVMPQGTRLERVWSDLKLWWNKFHALKSGFVADDCQPNSAFSLLSDKTCLATFLGFENEDNELLKVMKALMMVQVTPHLYVQVHRLPACVGNISMAKCACSPAVVTKAWPKGLLTSTGLLSYQQQGQVMCLVCLHSKIWLTRFA